MSTSGLTVWRVPEPTGVVSRIGLLAGARQGGARRTNASATTARPMIAAARATEPTVPRRMPASQPPPSWASVRCSAKASRAAPSHSGGAQPAVAVGAQGGGEDEEGARRQDRLDGRRGPGRRPVGEEGGDPHADDRGEHEARCRPVRAPSPWRTAPRRARCRPDMASQVSIVGRP